MNIHRRLFQKTSVAALLSGCMTSAFAAPYKVDTLVQTPHVYGTTLPTMATHINASGEAAGRTEVGESGTGSVYWNAAGQITNLTPGDYPESSTAGISDAGSVVYSDVAFGGQFYSWKVGTVTNLGMGFANAVNSKGQIVGTFGGVFGILTAGVLTPLPLPALGSYPSASDINNNGDVVGAVLFSDVNAYRAVIWRNGTVQQIASLPGDIKSTAYAINDAGQVVGFSSSSTNNLRAFFWENGVITNLGLAGDAQSFALGINNAGAVVGGVAATGSYNNHPFVWQNGVRSDLSSVVGEGNCSAYDINSNGALLVNCTRSTVGGPQAFRLTPVASAADLSVSLNATPIPGTAGLPIVFKSTVTNIGNATTTNASFKQTLPNGIALNSVATNKGTCSGTSTVTCALGDLAAEASAVVTLTTTPLVTGNYSDYYSTSVVAATATAESSTVNNAVNLPFTVFANNAALSVHSANSQTTATKGTNITYTWNVSNGGPLNASNAVLTDTLPSSLAFVSAKTTAGTCTGTVTIKCNLGNYQYGGINVTIVAKTKVSGTITNSATVTSTTPDSYLGDNVAKVVTKVR